MHWDSSTRQAITLPDGRQLARYTPAITVYDSLNAVGRYREGSDEWTLDGEQISEAEAEALLRQARHDTEA